MCLTDRILVKFDLHFLITKMFHITIVQNGLVNILHVSAVLNSTVLIYVITLHIIIIFLIVVLLFMATGGLSLSLVHFAIEVFEMGSSVQYSE